MCSLGSEIAAARLLAPYFGDSTIIWANTIGVVLIALSVGYWYGGRVADRWPDERLLRYVVLLAAVLLAVVPLLAGPFFDAVIGAFDELEAGAALGSLIGVLFLISLPLVLLGTVSPWALKLALRDTSSAGEVAGRLYAVSTVGSLLGTFLSALLLIPAIGTQRTFLLFAGLLALAAVATRGMPRRAFAVPAVLVALLALPPGVTKPAASADVRVLAERETTYQYARVVQFPTERVLELNEGQAVHSVARPGTVLVGGYWDAMLVAPFSVLDRPPRRLAMLGNAAGTIPRAYGRYFPQTAIDGVEIDGELSELGRRWFGMGDVPQLTVHEEDARPFLRRRAGARYDVIGVDAYRQPYIPFYLATKEFFALAKARLAPGGVLMVNVGHPEGQDGLERTLTRTLRTAFRHVVRWPVRETSTLLVASDVDPTPARLLRGPAAAQEDLRPIVEEAASKLAPSLDGGSVYTDDRAPVEWLVDASIVQYAADRR